ncbi:MAG: phage baseplate assembly protein V [Pseudomonadales bacterium]
MNMMLEQSGVEADRESDGFLKGLAVATVVDNEDPEGLARVRVLLPWQEEGQQSYWARIAVPMAMGTRGVYFLPEVDDEVLVGFDRGDPTHPYVIGALWNGQNTPPVDNGDGKNDSRMIRSRAESELHFFDGDKPSVELLLKDGKHLLMDDNGILLEDGQGNSFQIETSSGAMKLKCTGAMELEGQSVTIKGTTVEVNGSSSLTLKGGMVLIN